MIRTVVYSACVLLFLTVVVTEGFPIDLQNPNQESVLSMIQPNGNLIQRQKRGLLAPRIGTLGQLDTATGQVNGGTMAQKTGAKTDQSVGTFSSILGSQVGDVQKELGSAMNTGKTAQDAVVDGGSGVRTVFVDKGTEADKTMVETKTLVDKKVESQDALALKPDDSTNPDRMNPIPVEKVVKAAAVAKPAVVEEPAPQPEAEPEADTEEEEESKR